tara:strand:- start:1399 stop:1641 length:243 start_codon:yes stop_codon:yes gene_type:complete
MIKELEHKIMTKKRFTKAVEVLVSQKNMSYIDAMTYIIEQRGMDYMNVKKLLSPALKEKLTQEASELHLVKIKQKNQLPV